MKNPEEIYNLLKEKFGEAIVEFLQASLLIRS